jgi:ATP-dependent Clp protease protease subunit
MSAQLLPLPLERTLYLDKQVDQASMGLLCKTITTINDHDVHLKKLYAVYDLDYNAKPIILKIDSFGGGLNACYALIAEIERSKTPVHTIAVGAAMSCGFMILISGHKRFAYKYSAPLYHQISSAARGTYQEIKEGTENLKRWQKILESTVLKRTKITKEKLKDMRLRKIDWELTPDEALKYGVIDEII